MNRVRLFLAVGALALLSSPSRADQLIGSLPNVHGGPPQHTSAVFISPTRYIRLHSDACPDGPHVLGREYAAQECDGVQFHTTASCTVNGQSIAYAGHYYTLNGTHQCVEIYSWQDVVIDLGSPGPVSIDVWGDNTTHSGDIWMWCWDIWTVGEPVPPAVIGSLTNVHGGPPQHTSGVFISPTRYIRLHSDACPDGPHILGREYAAQECDGVQFHTTASCTVNGQSIAYAGHYYTLNGTHQCVEIYSWQDVVIDLGSPGPVSIDVWGDNTTHSGDIWIWCWDVWAIEDPPAPFEILSATFDRHHYQNGEDAAILTVEMRKNGGEGGALLNLHGYATARIGDNAAEGHSYFSWPLQAETWSVDLTLNIPWAEQSSEYTALVVLDDGTETLDDDVIDPAFIGTGLDDAVIESYQNDLDVCSMDSNSECILYLIDMIPVASTGSHAWKFVERMCEAGALRRGGFPHESWAVMKKGFLEFGKTAVGIYGPGFGELYQYYKVYSIFTTAGKFAKECSDGEFGGGGAGFREDVPAGELVDSLAVWMHAGNDSLTAILADVLLLEGQCQVAVEADSAWANSDSTGLNFVEFGAAESLGTATLVTKGVHRLTRAEGENPRSCARFMVTSELGQVLNVGLLHRTEADTLVFVRYPEFTVTDSSVVTVVVADSISVPMLEVDLDGDGTVDFLWYPGAAGVDEEASLPARGGPGLSLATAPNPMAGSTSFVLRSAATLKGVSVSVYDVAGRELRRLAVGDLAPGVHQVAWDGRAEDGRQVASGIYYCVGSYAGGGSTAKRLVVLR